jgi:hypothetical protein
MQRCQVKQAFVITVYVDLHKMDVLKQIGDGKAHFWPALCFTFSNSDRALGTNGCFFGQSIPLLLLCFFTTFFFPSTLALHYQRLSIYTTSLNNEGRVTLFFPPSCPSLSYLDQHLPFA